MNILFDNVALHQSPYVINTLHHENAPQRDVFSGVLARGRGGVIVNTEYKMKTITISGHIHAHSGQALDEYIDAAHALFSREDKSLDIDYGARVRRYKVTSTDFRCVREHYHITFVPFSVSFIVPDGIGIDPVPVIETFENETSADTTRNFTVSGSAYPWYTMTFDITTAGGMETITILINGNAVTISDAFSNGDSLILNTKNLSVALNATEIEYTGLFPQLRIGVNSIRITHDGTTSNYNFSLLYNKSYL